jgi:hypothetical protein
MDQTEQEKKSASDQSLAGITEDQGCDAGYCGGVDGCFDECSFEDECCC